MMAESQVSVGASLAYGWRLWAASWRAIWGVLAVSSLAMTVCQAGAYAMNYDLLGIGLAAQILIQPMLYGAVFRLAFADRHPGDPAFELGHAGLQWRAMEWRLLGSEVLLALFMALMGLLCLVVISCLVFGVILAHGGHAAPTTPKALMAALGDDGQAILWAAVCVAVVLMCVMSTRLSLAYAATADRGKVVALESWPLTRTQFWRILAVLLLVQLLYQILLTLAVGSLMDEQGGGMAPGAAMFSALVTGVTSGGIIAPVLAGVMGYYYRSLSPVPANGASGPRP